MTETDALYEVREQTGNPAHASVDDVTTLVLERARDPRENHHNAHFDEAMAAVVDRYGAEAVRTVIHRVLVEHYPFRTATVTLDMRNFDGVRIGTTAVWTLRELNAQGDD
ncbi:hypothetical protein [Haloquadratum walsbyi]|jgi:hypothetical protein|uniref:DUF8158 domain-containing protein n=1 Tax=Haloquadratum walsbyi (strain DSM 16790 / HBSQ001) TaxID=362976 RepID=Q18IB0_HALWD|nr:hypothetical protein [Haloquadratum walsbyi]CAJ52264.1 uncharacterized protein HQ_2137A [Haloquadratum walsbyi DSM 16790]